MNPGGNRLAASRKRIPFRSDWLSQAIGKMATVTRLLAEGPARQPWQRRHLLIEQFEPRETPAALITGFSDDTGILGDKVTADKTLKVDGTAGANSLVKLYDGGVFAGSSTANSQGAWSITTAALADGAHAFTATESASTSLLTDTAYTLSPDGDDPYTINQDLGQNWTFEAEYLMNSNNGGGLNTIFSYGLHTDGVLVRTLRQDGLFLKGVDAGSPDLFGGATTSGQFVPVRITYANDGTTGTLKVFANGVLKGTAVASGPLTPASKSIWIGSAHHAPGEGFDGKVRNIRITTGTESAPSPSYSITVDATAPVASPGPVFSPRATAVDSVQVEFAEPVTGLELSDFTLSHNGQNVPLKLGVSGGLPANYFNNTTLSGSPVLSRTDATINFDWSGGSPGGQVGFDQFSARWEGFVLPQFTDIYTFTTETDDGVRLWVDGKLVVDKWEDMSPSKHSGTIGLTANKPVSIKMEYYENGGGATARLLWASPSRPEEIVPSDRLLSSLLAGLSGTGKSYVLSGLSSLASGEGDYKLSVAAGAVADAAGNQSLGGSVAWSVDNTAPAAPSFASFSPDTGIVGDRVTKDQKPTLAGTSEAKSLITVFDGAVQLGTVQAGADGSWTFTTLNLADGLHAFTALAKDEAGNQSVASTTFSLTIDTASPLVPVIAAWGEDSGVAGDGITSDATLAISGTAEAGSVVLVRAGQTVIGELTAGVNGTWSFTTAALVDGEHSITVISTDAAGNVSNPSSALSVRVDTASPLAPVIAGWGDDTGVAGDAITSDATVTLSGTAEPGAAVSVFDGGTLLGTVPAMVTGSWSFTSGVLADGQHSFTAKARDAAGNQSGGSTALTVTVDTASPLAPVIAGWGDDTGVAGDGITSDATVTLSGTGEPGAVVHVRDGQTIIGELTTGANGTWSFTTAALADGNHSITATAKDPAGNLSGVSTALVVTVDTASPLTPVIAGWGDDTGLAGDGITSDATVTLSGTAEPGAVVHVRDGQTIVGELTTGANGTWSFTTAALADGQHSFTAKAKDAAGNVSNESSTLSVTVDTVAPGVPDILTWGDDTGDKGDWLTRFSSITLSGKAEPGTTLTLFEGGVPLGATMVSQDGAWSCATTPLGDGSHVLVVQAADAAGNRSGAAEASSIRIDSLAPLAPTATTVAETLNADGFWVEGEAEPGSMVTVARGGVVLGSMRLAAGQASYSIPVPLAQEVVNLLDVTATDAAGNESPAIRVTVTEVSTLPTVFTVTTEGDTDIGLFHRGTLRWSISQANASAGADIIRFNIPGGGVRTITPATALPDLAGGITIDGFTQPGAKANTGKIDEFMNSIWAVHLNAPGMTGFVATGTGNTIRGLSIQAGSSGVSAVRIDGSGNTVAGNRIGLDSANHATGWQSLYGIELVGNGNLVGGDQPADRNYFSNNIRGVGGTGSNNRVSGNFIGSAGKFQDPNSFVGVLFADGAKGNIIGTNSDGVGDAQEANVISSNNYAGIYLEFATDTVIRGNIIGLNPSGTSSIGNANSGVVVIDSPGTMVGGFSAIDGNIISGNGVNGISVLGSSSKDITIVGNTIGLLPDGATKAGNGHSGVYIGNYSSSSLHWDYARHPWVGGPTKVTISSNTISGNGVGVTVDSNSLYGSKSSEISINGNRIGASRDGASLVPNSGPGISVDSAANGTINGNTIVSSGGPGIRIIGVLSAGNLVKDNKIQASGSEGVIVDSAPSTTILGNSIAAPGFTAISVVNANGVVVGSLASGNVISAAATGVALSGASLLGAMVSGNTVRNALAGITATGGAAVSIVGNTLDAITGAGISLSGVVGGSLVGDNTLSGVSGKGIDIGSSTGVKIAGNALTGIGGTGISISGSEVGELAAGPGDYSIGINSSALAGPTAIGSSGLISLVAPAGKAVTLGSDLAILSPSAILVSGTIASANRAISLGDADTPVLLAGDTTIDSGAGATVLGGSVDGAFNLAITGTGAHGVAGPVGRNTPLSGLVTGSGGSITLAGVTVTGNISLGAHATLTGGVTTTAGNFTAKGGLASPGDLAIHAPGGSILLDGKSTVSGRATLAAGGGIAAGPFIVAGPAVFTAGAGSSLALDGANDFAGTVTVDAGAVSIRDSNALDVALSSGPAVVVAGGSLLIGGTVAGALTITSGGPVAQTGALKVTGAMNLAAPGMPVMLSNAGNDFTGEVGVVAGSTTLRDANNLDVALAAGSSSLFVGGALAVRGTVAGDLEAEVAGSVNNSGILTVSGSARLRVSGASDVKLTGSNALGFLDISSGNQVLVSGASLGGLRVAGAAAPTITGNTFASALVNGIDITGATHAVVSGNKVSGSGHSGIVVANSSGADVRDNTVVSSGADGILLQAVPGALVGGNIINNAAGHGIRLIGLSGAMVSGNTVSNSGLDAIRLPGTFHPNRLAANLFRGIPLNRQFVDVGNPGREEYSLTNLANPPVIAAVSPGANTTVVTGSHLGRPNTATNIELFRTGPGGAADPVGVFMGTTDALGVLLFGFTVDGAISGTGFRAMATSPGQSSELSPELQDGKSLSVSVLDGAGQSVMVNEPFGRAVRFVVRDPAGAMVPHVPLRLTLPSGGVAGAFGDGVALVRGIYGVRDAFVVADGAGVATSPPILAGSVAGDFAIKALAGESGPAAAAGNLEIRPPAPMVLEAAAPGASAADPTLVKGEAYSGSLVRVYRANTGALVGSKQLAPGQLAFSIPVPSAAENDRAERWIVTATFDANLPDQTDQAGGNESNTRPVAETPARELYLNASVLPVSGSIQSGSAIAIARNTKPLPGISASYHSVSTLFGTGTEGWTAHPAGTVAHAPADQVDDGSLAMQASSPAGPRYFSAPAGYLGDKSPYLGGALSFSLRSAPGGTGAVEVVLEGSGLALHRNVGTAPGVSWKTYSASFLADGGWRMGGSAGDAATQEQLASVLGSLDKVLIRGTDDSGVVTYGLDTVSLEGPGSVGYALSLDLVRNSKNHFVLVETNRFGNVSGTTILPLVTEDSIAPRPPSFVSLAGDSNVDGDRVHNANRLVLVAKADANAHPLQIASMNQAIKVFRDGVQVGAVVPASDGSWSFADPDSLPDGAYAYTATATDRAGNESVRSLVFKVVVDTTAPLAPSAFSLAPDTGIAGDGVTGSTTPRLSGSGEPGSLVEVFEGNVSLGSGFADSRGRWGIDLPVLAEGAHSFKIQSTDLAGNTSTQVSHGVVVDTVAPASAVIGKILEDSGGDANDAVTNVRRLTLAGIGEPGSFVNLTRNGAKFGQARVGQDGNWAFDATAIELLDGRHLFEATATDLAGNPAPVSQPFAVVVDARAPLAPRVTGFTPDTGNPRDRITAIANPIALGVAEANSRVVISIDGVQAGETLADQAGFWAFQMPSLGTGAHSVLARALDLAGNASPDSLALTVTIDAGVPGTPDLTGISNDTGTSAYDLVTRATSFSLLGSTGDPGLTVRIYMDGTLVGQTKSNDTGSFAFAVSGLTQGKWQFAAESINAAGTASGLGATLVVTIDTTAPGTPTGLGILDDLGANAADLLTSDDTLVVKGFAEPGSMVDVQLAGQTRRGSANGSTGEFRVSFEDLDLADGSYPVQVLAYDIAGNRSARSASATIRVDTAAPALAVNRLESDTGSSATDFITGDTTPTLVGTAEAGVVVFARSGGVPLGSPVVADARGAWILPLGDVPSGAYSLEIVATDAAGNKAASPLALVVDADSPPNATALAISPDTGLLGDFITSAAEVVLSGAAENGALAQVKVNGIAQPATTVSGTGSWSIPIRLAGEGENRIWVSVVDPAGNACVASELLVVRDSAAPLPPSLGGITPDTGVSSLDRLTSSSQVTISGSAEPGSAVSIGLDGTAAGLVVADDGGSWSFALPGLESAGGHVVTVRAMDAAGNASTEVSTAILFDPTAPGAPVITGILEGQDVDADGLTANPEPAVRGTAEPHALVRVVVDGIVGGTVAANAQGAWTATLSPLADGAHKVAALAVDAAGNQGGLSQAFSFLVDTSAPAAPGIDEIGPDGGFSPSDGIIASETISVSGHGEPGSRLRVRLGTLVAPDITIGANGLWTTTFAGIPDGTHLLDALTVDPAGNMASAGSRLLVIDTTAPAAPRALTLDADTGAGSSDGITRDRPTFLAGLGEPGARVRVTAPALGASLSLVIGGDGSWKADLNPLAQNLPGGLLPEGETVLLVSQEDPAGNKSAATEFVITLDTATPEAPQVLGAVSPSSGRTITSGQSLSASQPGFSGVSEPGARVRVEIRSATALVSSFTVVADSNGDWELTPSRPLADNTYTVTAVATDHAGNESAAGTVFSLVVDTKAPAAPSVAGIGPDTGASKTDNLTREATRLFGLAEGGATVRFFEILEDGSRLLVGEGVAGSDRKVEVVLVPGGSGLSHGGHAIVAVATDSAGNAGAESAVRQVEVDAIAPGTPEGLSIGDDTGLFGDGVTSDTTPTVSGLAEPGATVIVRAGGAGAPARTAVVSDDGSWSVTMSLPEGIHNLEIVAVDRAGNASALPAISTLVIDKAAPGAPAGLAVTPDSGRLATDGITSGNRPEISGLAEPGSVVSVRCTPLGTGVPFLFGTATADSSGKWVVGASDGLGDDKYQFEVDARDLAGNVSAKAKVSVTVDTITPQAVLSFPSDAAHYNLKGWAGSIRGTAQTLGGSAIGRITATISDSLGRYYNGVDFQAQVASVAASGTSSWTVPLPAAALASGLGYSVSIVAEDLAGNAEQLQAVSFRFDTDAPVPALTAPAPASNLASQELVIDFGEPVRSFPIDRLTATDGLRVELADQDGDAGRYTLSLTPTREGAFNLKLPAGAVLDLAGNPAPAIGFSTAFDVSTGAADAQPLEFSGGLTGWTGVFARPGDQDWFRIAAPSSGGLTINLSGARSLGTTLRLVDADGNGIALADNSIGAFSEIRANVTAGQVLFVAAQARGESTGSYGLSLSMGSVFLDDFADTRQEAAGLVATGPGVYSLPGEINQAGDADYFRFVPQATGMITFTATPTGSGTLVPSLAGGVVENQFTTQTEQESRTLGQAIVRFPVVANVTYYLRVGSHAASGVEAAGGYLLESTFVSAGDEAGDDQFGTPGRIDLAANRFGDLVAMRLESAGDADGFELVLPQAGGRVMVSVAAGFGTRVVIGSGPAAITRAVENGRLLVEGVFGPGKTVPVRVFSDGQAGPYTLVATQDERPETAQGAPVVDPGPAGAILAGAIQQPGDEDVAGVTVRETGKVIARLDPVGEVFPARVEIVSADGDSLGSAVANQDFSLQATVSVTAGQEVFVRVAGESGATGSYRLSLRQVPDDHSDTGAGATPLAAGMAGELHYPGDRDYFVFTAGQAGPHVVRARAVSGDRTEPALTVYREGSGGPETSIDAGTTDAAGLVTLNLAEGERILVEVAGLGRLGRFSLEVGPDQILAGDDHHDTINRGQGSGAGSLVTTEAPAGGAIEIASDVDHLRFTVTAPGRHTLSAVAAPGSWLDPRMGLYRRDDAGAWNLLASDDDGGEAANAQIFQSLEAGEYLVRVTGSRGTTGAYGVSLVPFVTQSQTTADDAPDSPAQARVVEFTSVPNGEKASVTARIDRGADLDNFSLTPSMDGTLVVTLVANDAGLDPVLGYSAGTEVSANDNAGPGTVDSRIVVEAVAGKTIILSASSFGLTSGGYTLAATLARPVEDDHAQNPVNASHLAGATLEGNLEYTGDRDVFRYEPAFAGILTIRLDNNTGVANPRLRVLDSQANVLAEDIAGGEGLNSLLTTRVAAGETVHIEVASSLGETGSYRVAVDLADDDFGNDPAGSHPLAVSGNSTETLGRVNASETFPDGTPRPPDSDWFRFRADRSGLVNFRADSAAGLDPYLFVYNSSLDLIGSQDNRSDSDHGASVPMEVIGGHTYYVRVAGSAGTTGEYTLESRPVVDDFGNSAEASTPLEPDEAGVVAIQGAIDAAYDPDWFRFTPAEGGRVRVGLGASESMLDTNLTAFDSAGRLIVANDDADPGTKDSLVEFSVQAGETYYLKAQGFGSSEGAYSLQVVPIAEIGDEYGDTVDMAEAWALDSSGSGNRTGALQSARDIDLLKVVSPLSGMLELTVEVSGAEASVRLLSRRDGEIVQVASGSGTGALSLRAPVVEGSEYFIRIGSEGGGSAAYSLGAAISTATGAGLRPIDADVLSKLSDEFNSGFVQKISTLGAHGDLTRIQNEILGDLVDSFLLVNGVPATNVLIIYLDPVDFTVSDGSGAQVGRTTNGGAVAENASASVSSRGALDIVVVPVSNPGTFNMNLMGVGGGRVLAGATMVTPQGKMITPSVGFNGNNYSALPAGEVPKEGLSLVLDFRQGTDGGTGGGGGTGTGGGNGGNGDGGSSVVGAAAGAVVNSTLIQTLATQASTVFDLEGLGDALAAQATGLAALLLTASTIDGARDGKEIPLGQGGLLAFLANPAVQANLRAVATVGQDVASSVGRGARFVAAKAPMVERLVASAASPLAALTGTVVPGKVRDAVTAAVTGTLVEMTRQVDVTASALARALGAQAARFSATPAGPASDAKQPAPGARSEAPGPDARDLVAAEWGGCHPDLVAGSSKAVDDSVWGETGWMVAVEDSRRQNAEGAITAGLVVAGFLTPGWVRSQLESAQRRRLPVARLKIRDGDQGFGPG